MRQTWKFFVVHRALQSRETSPPRSGRLDSWKEIAAYLGRQVRTLHLWEKAEKLPVHRHIHSKRGTVYAFKSELDAWKQTRTLLYANRNKGVQCPLGTAAKEMVGVLPFENLSGDASQEYLGDGLTEEVISQLGRIRPEQLRVIARTSSMHYKNSDKSIAVIAEELGVTYLLEGSVRRNKGRIRVTVTLIRAADQVNLWSESYDRDLADIFVLQMDLAGRIAASVVSELASIQPVAQFTRPPRTDTQAYEAYLCGLNYNRQRTEESLLKAVHYFNRAIQKDPNLTVAYAGLADAYVLLSVYGVIPALEVMPLAKASALRALGNTPELAEAHATLGQILSCDWEWDAAHKEYKLALELNPSYPAAHHYFAEYLAVVGERERALQQIDLACRLDPRSVIASVWRGNLLRLCGQPKEAVHACIATVKLDPNYVLAHWALGLAYEQIGSLSEALSEFRSAAQLSGRSPGVLSALGHCQAVAGLLDEARETLQQLQLLSARRYIPAYEFAVIYVGLGNEDQAVEFIGKAFEERSPWLMMLPLEPRLADLKSHARFNWLLSNLNLPDAARPAN
ncbi:MAG: hypothetical protein WAN33_13570 [Candidatus Acidiferrales bacterium]